MATHHGCKRLRNREPTIPLCELQPTAVLPSTYPAARISQGQAGSAAILDGCQGSHPRPHPSGCPRSAPSRALQAPGACAEPARSLQPARLQSPSRGPSARWREQHLAERLHVRACGDSSLRPSLPSRDRTGKRERSGAPLSPCGNEAGERTGNALAPQQHLPETVLRSYRPRTLKWSVGGPRCRGARGLLSH